MLNLPDADWPEPSDERTADNTTIEELRKQLYQAKLDEVKATRDVMRQTLKDVQANDYIREQALYNAYLDVAKGQLDRSQSKAITLVQAAAAIGTIYAAVIGLNFGLGGGQIKPLSALPIRGIIPTIFLAASIFFAMVYLAYISRPHSIYPFDTHSRPSGLPSQRLIEQRNIFLIYTASLILERANWLNASIQCLAFAVIFIPAAFVSIPDWGVVVSAVVFGLIVVVVLIWSEVVARRPPPFR